MPLKKCFKSSNFRLFLYHAGIAARANAFQSGACQFDEIINVIVFGLKTSGESF